MAKKRPAPEKAPRVKLQGKDIETVRRLNDLATNITVSAQKKKDVPLDIPTKALSNVKFNKTKRFLEMGKNTNRRQLFNLSQAKAYMQTLLVASGCHDLIQQGKTTSIRGLLLQAKTHDRGYERKHVQ